jgi:hypothetical protein
MHEPLTYEIGELDPSSSVAYLALSVLCSSQNSLIPELLYLFSPKQLVDFIRIYGGETLTIPTPKEFGRDLMVALASYHIMAEEKSWDWFELTYCVDKEDARIIKMKLERWWRQLTPDEVMFIESLKIHNKSRDKKEELRKLGSGHT